MADENKKQRYKDTRYLGLIIAIVAIVVTIIIWLWPIPPPPPSDFSISIDPMLGAIQAGGVIQTTVSVMGITGYDHPVSLSATGQPSDVITAFVPPFGEAKPSYTSSMTITVDRNVPAGDYTLVIKGTGADGKEHSCSYTLTVKPSDTPTPTPTPIEDAALDFSLAVVETYLTGDADKFCSFLADTLYSLEGEGPITKEEAISIIKEDKPFPSGKDYSEFTMEDYLENYRPKIMDYGEYSKEYPEVFSSLSIDGWKPDADDFLFLGYEVKTGKEGFMWEDLLGFMVTYQNKKWEFIAFSG